MTEQRFTSRSPAQTRRIAGDLVRSLAGRATLALHGDLGSGKTCFVQGVADALGVAQPVTSPTFTMIGEYAGSRRLFHVDLYRLRTADEAAGIGLEDYLDAPGITAVEWAERAAGFLGPDAIHIYFAALRHPRHRRILIHRP